MKKWLHKHKNYILGVLTLWSVEFPIINWVGVTGLGCHYNIPLLVVCGIWLALFIGVNRKRLWDDTVKFWTTPADDDWYYYEEEDDF